MRMEPDNYSDAAGSLSQLYEAVCKGRKPRARITEIPQRATRQRHYFLTSLNACTAPVAGTV